MPSCLRKFFLPAASVDHKHIHIKEQDKRCQKNQHKEKYTPHDLERKTRQRNANFPDQAPKTPIQFHKLPSTKVSAAETAPSLPDALKRISPCSMNIGAFFTSMINRITFSNFPVRETVNVNGTPAAGCRGISTERKLITRLLWLAISLKSSVRAKKESSEYAKNAFSIFSASGSTCSSAFSIEPADCCCCSKASNFICNVLMEL